MKRKPKKKKTIDYAETIKKLSVIWPELPKRLEAKPDAKGTASLQF